MAVDDVYLLTLHEPYQTAEHHVPINATIVHALTLLHPQVPQPDGGLMYRCLTEFPGRTPGCLVPVSTLTFELAGGQLWPEIADWQQVSQAVVQLARTRACDAMPLGLPQHMAVVLVGGPNTTANLHRPDGSTLVLAGSDRQGYLDELTAAIRTVTADGPFWPGDYLVRPPAQPQILPYQPYRSQDLG